MYMSMGRVWMGVPEINTVCAAARRMGRRKIVRLAVWFLRLWLSSQMTKRCPLQTLSPIFCAMSKLAIVIWSCLRGPASFFLMSCMATDTSNQASEAVATARDLHAKVWNATASLCLRSNVHSLFLVLVLVLVLREIPSVDTANDDDLLWVPCMSMGMPECSGSAFMPQVQPS